MVIKNDLMLAILAMDFDNRGYGEGIEGLGGLGSKVGNATVSTDSETLPVIAADGQTLSFYALAYSYDYDNDGNDETIISYRGADVQPGLFPPRLGEDVVNGWPIGGGIIEGTQVELARTGCGADGLCGDFRQDHLQDMTGSG